MSVEIIPLRNRILATRIEANSVTSGGLFLPEVARERPQEAIVVAVGKGEPIPALARFSKSVYEVPTVPPAVTVGDRILIGKYVGAEVSIDGTMYVILREEEILAILRDAPVVASTEGSNE